MKSGSITVREDGKRSLELCARDGSIDVNLVDVSFNVPPDLGIVSSLAEARGFAKILRERGMTLTVRSRDTPVLRLGKGARPRLSRIATLSGSVEVADLRELRRLDRRLRAE